MGIRDTVSSTLLNVFGAEPTSVLNLIPIANTVTYALWGLLGAFFFLCWKRKETEMSK